MSKILFVVLIGAVCISAEKYVTKYDDADIQTILRSDRLLKNYVNCLLEKGKCTPDGLELKKVIPDALQTSCKNCSEKQRTGSRMVLRYLITNKRNWFDDLEAKYDPARNYRKVYHKELEAEGLRL